MKQIFKEGIVKNIVIMLFLFFSFFIINDYLAAITLSEALLGNSLIAVSIVAVVACFGCFSFTYEKIKLDNIFSRYLAHFTTGILLLVIGISLIFTSLLFKLALGYFWIVDLTLAMLYLATVGYDFWDMLRVI
ncbi:hypothetical protein HYX12_04900 [Candidatus Woesearchaeota archaeon]|nr:hypothetical protein [Candidatus Woesearchaeota archaeon]